MSVLRGASKAVIASPSAILRHQTGVEQVKGNALRGESMAESSAQESLHCIPTAPSQILPMTS